MNSMGTCPQCGTLLFSEAAGGLCPRCLGALGFALATTSEGEPHAGPLRSRRLGDYELIEEIARGGMGVVYKARQVGLNRIVAVKVVLHGPFSSPEFVKRFRTEAEAVAGLQHPNIVAIYEVGQAGADHFFSMEYIEGQNLAEAVRAKPLPARRAAAYLKTIAEAVHFAHQHGVLHRDLKPSNVLLDIFDQPRVTDFGLAKLLNNDVELTTTGQVLGSPSHISPEQAAGKSDAASDIYSLGAVLYHLVTGRPPFQGETIQEILLQVQNAEPISPRRLKPSVPLDLQTICLKCLQKEPARRYASAKELADDLARFLENEPIHARPISRTGRLVRWCRRKPALAASLGVGAGLLLFVAIGSPIAVVLIERQREAAEAARNKEMAARVRAESAERETEQQLFASLVEQARATVLSGEMGHRVRALEALRRAAMITNAVEVRREVFAALALPDLRLNRELNWGEEYSLRKPDPAFERIALCRDRGPVEIRSMSDGRLLATLPATAKRAVYAHTEWSADGKYLAVKRDLDGGGSRADWEIWDTAVPKLLLQLRDIPLRSLDLRPGAPQVAVGHPTFWNEAGLKSGRMEILDFERKLELRSFVLPAGAFLLRWSPQGDRIAAAFWASNRQHVAVLDATNGATLALATLDDGPKCIAWHPSGRWLALPTPSGVVHTMNAITGETRALGQHKAPALTADFTQDGRYLFTGGWDNELHCWDTSAMRRVFTVFQDTYFMQLSGDGSKFTLFTPSKILLYDFERPTAFREFGDVLGARMYQAAFSLDGRWLAATAGQRLGLWDLANDGPGVFAADGFDGWPAFRPDGRELFVCRGNPGNHWGGRWRILPAVDNASAPALEKLPLHIPAGFIFFSAGSNSIATTTADGTQFLTGSEIETGSAHRVPTVSGVSKVSPDGKWFGVSAAFTATLHVHRLPDLKSVAKLDQQDNITEFFFSPSGDEVAVGSRAGIEFWSTASWRRTRVIPGFTHMLYAPDRRAFWLRKDLRTAGLYDAGTVEPLLLLPAEMLPLAVSADGKKVAVSVAARRLQVWDLAALRGELRKLELDWPAGLKQPVSPR